MSTIKRPYSAHFSDGTAFGEGQWTREALLASLRQWYDVDIYGLRRTEQSEATLNVPVVWSNGQLAWLIVTCPSAEDATSFGRELLQDIRTFPCHVPEGHAVLQRRGHAFRFTGTFQSIQEEVDRLQLRAVRGWSVGNTGLWRVVCRSQLINNTQGVYAIYCRGLEAAFMLSVPNAIMPDHEAIRQGIDKALLIRENIGIATEL